VPAQARSALVPRSTTAPARSLRRYQERKQVQERVQQAQVLGRTEQVPAQPVQ
jgi:hypothetical protein